MKGIINLFIFFQLVINSIQPPLSANMAVAEDNCLFIYYEQTFSLYSPTGYFRFDRFEDADLEDMDSYNCIVNALLYSDGQILLLDNKLNVIKEIDLNNLGIYSARKIAIENTNFLWLYDDYENKIYRLDIRRLDAHYISLAFLGRDVRRIQYRDNQLFFLNDKGIYSVDDFFQVKSELRADNLFDFFLFDNKLITVENNTVFLDKTKIKIFSSSPRICGIYHDKLVILLEGKLEYIPLK